MINRNALWESVDLRVEITHTHTQREKEGEQMF